MTRIQKVESDSASSYRTLMDNTEAININFAVDQSGRHSILSYSTPSLRCLVHLLLAMAGSLEFMRPGIKLPDIRFGIGL